MRRLAFATVLVLTGALAACTAETPPVAAPTTQPTITAPSAEPIAAPVLKPEGTALQNIDYFELVLQQLLEANANPTGRQIIDHLVAAGFDKSQMELSSPTTAIGRKADSVQFSVNMNGSCLIGQWSPEGYDAIEGPLLGVGTCLVGKTPPIDW